MKQNRNQERTAWYNHKRNATKRGIKFKITFEDWVKIWKFSLGPNWMKKRGRKKHQYCMARFKDKGAYELNNIRCITNAENHLEQWTKAARKKKSNQTRKFFSILTNREKLKIMMLGKKYALGYRHTEEAKAKMKLKPRVYGRQPFLGHKHSVETINKMKKARKSWWDNRRNQDVHYTHS